MRGASPAAAFLALALAACGTVKSPTEPVEGPEGPAVTFSQIQINIFTPICAKAGCHDPATAQNGLVLAAGQSYGLLVNHASLGSALPRVTPGDPERSYIIKKLRGDPDISGDRMPQDGPPYLTPEQIAGIAGWIREGALND